VLDLDRLIRLRTHLFHLTARSNLRSIATEGALHPAEEILRRGNRLDLLRVRRLRHESVRLGKSAVLVRDQAPLHAGAALFEPGWGLSEWVEHVNRHVFFWPGSASGPISSGLNQHQHYSSESPALLRIPAGSIILVGSPAPLFCRFNSGAPRYSGGRPSARGAATYLSAEAFPGPPSRVIEVVFRGSVFLPAATEVSASFSGPWQSLARAAA